MSRFIFRSLIPEDTEQVKKLLQSSSLKSFYTVCRVPVNSIDEYLTLNDAEFDSIIVEDKNTFKIIAIAFVVYRNYQYKNKIISVAYLQQLYISEKYRNGLLLARGYKYLKLLIEKRNPHLALMSILNNNQQVQKLLTSNRSSLPKAHKEHEISTITFDIKKSKVRADKNVTYENMSDEVLEFIKDNQKDIAIPINQEKLIQWRINGKCVLVKRENNKIIKLLLLWDQSDFRSLRVIKYSPVVSLIRPLYNIFAYFTGRDILPDIPWYINNIYGFSFVEKENKENSIAELIETAIEYLKNDRISYLTISMPKGLYNFSKQISYNSIESTVYSLWWNNKHNKNKFKISHLDAPFL